MTTVPATEFLPRGKNIRIAYHRTEGRAPGVIFLGGFKSDMTGSKATALQAFCEAKGYGFVRFDYQGHGRSSGTFAEGTIGEWLADALAVLDGLTEGPQILIGSSMGGWLALHAALMRPQRVAGLIGIAAAPDFTEELIWKVLSPTEQTQLMETGVYHAPSCYGEEPYPITRTLIEEARGHLLMGRELLDIRCPVRLIHGVRDADVPWQTATRISEKLAGDDVRVTLVKDGDHRMSSPEHLALLCGTLEEMMA